MLFFVVKCTAKDHYCCFQVFFVSSLIFNGVCVKFHGWLDVERLRGFGLLVFDETSAHVCSCCWLM